MPNCARRRGEFHRRRQHVRQRSVFVRHVVDIKIDRAGDMAAFELGKHVFFRRQPDRRHPNVDHHQIFIVDMLRKPLRESPETESSSSLFACCENGFSLYTRPRGDEV